MTSPETLEELRRRIAKIDLEIIRALRERMDLSREIARIKRAGRMDIEVREVEEVVLSRARSLAGEMELDPEFVDALFRLIIDESKKEQQREIDG